MLIMASSYNFRFRSLFCVLCSISGFSVKVKLSVPLLCLCALPGKALPNDLYCIRQNVKPYLFNHSLSARLDVAAVLFSMAYLAAVRKVAITCNQTEIAV